MCLVPGMLAPAPARPSARARQQAAALAVLAVMQVGVALALAATFSAGAVLQSIFFVAYSFFVLRPFRSPEPLVFIESVLCYALLAGMSGALGALTAASIAAERHALLKKFKDDLRPWQVSSGIALSGVAAALYLASWLVALALFRNLQRSVTAESLPFVSNAAARGGVHSQTSGSRPGGFGTMGSLPTGSYAATAPREQAMPEPSSAASPFTGKGYRLSDASP